MRLRRFLTLSSLALVLGHSPIARAKAVFHDDFESGTGAWTLQGGWGTTTTGPRSPTRSHTDSPSTNYTGNVTGATKTATLATAIDLSAATAPRLTFWIRHQSEFLHDYVHIETSKN